MHLPPPGFVGWFVSPLTLVADFWNGITNIRHGQLLIGQGQNRLTENICIVIAIDTAAAETLKKWDGGRASQGGNEGMFGVRGKYWCKSVQFGAFWRHQVIKSPTENRRFSVPLIKVGRNSSSLPYVGSAAHVLISPPDLALWQIRATTNISSCVVPGAQPSLLGHGGSWHFQKFKSLGHRVG